MPTCPGCRQRVAHDDLPMHERYCAYIWTQRGEVAEYAGRWTDHLTRSVRSLDARLADADADAGTRLAARVERLERRLDDRFRSDE